MKSNQTCEDLIKKHSSSFYHAFKHLNDRDRHAVFSIYGFCRMADDAIDEQNDFDELMHIKETIQRSYNQDNVDGAIFNCMKTVFSQYEFQITPFLDLIKGMEQDFNKTLIVSYDDLDHYCYLVAGTVGLMLTPIIASEQYHEQEELIKKVAISLGKAMQITNILRDVGQDFLNNRVYLPQQLLDKYEIDLHSVMQYGVDESYKRMIDFLIGKANEHYSFFYQHITVFNKDARKSVYFSAVFYQGILKELKRNHYNNITKRQYVSSMKKKWLYILHSIKLKIKGVI